MLFFVYGYTSQRNNRTAVSTTWIVFFMETLKYPFYTWVANQQSKQDITKQSLEKRNSPFMPFFPTSVAHIVVQYVSSPEIKENDVRWYLTEWINLEQGGDEHRYTSLSLKESVRAIALNPCIAVNRLAFHAGCFMMAAHTSNLRLIRELRANNKQRQCPIRLQEERALAHASETGKTDVVRVLLERDVDVHFKYDYALRKAARSGHHEICAELIAAGAHIGAGHNYALRWAIHFRHAQTVFVLVDCGANIGELNPRQRQLAIDCVSRPVAKFEDADNRLQSIKEEKKMFKLKNRFKQTQAEARWMLSGLLPSSSYLSASVGQIGSYMTRDWSILGASDMSDVKRLLTEETGVYSSLHQALVNNVQRGIDDVVELLLANDAFEHGGRPGTLLLAAQESGFASTTKILLAYGAVVNQEAIIGACKKGRDEILELYLWRPETAKLSLGHALKTAAESSENRCSNKLVDYLVQHQRLEAELDAADLWHNLPVVLYLTQFCPRVRPRLLRLACEQQNVSLLKRVMVHKDLLEDPQWYRGLAIIATCEPSWVKKLFALVPLTDQSLRLMLKGVDAGLLFEFFAQRTVEKAMLRDLLVFARTSGQEASKIALLECTLFWW